MISTIIRAALVAATLLLTLGTAVEAHAGAYRVAQCDPALGAGHADARFFRNSQRYIGVASCGGDGLSIRHDDGPEPTESGRLGAWTITAPAALELTSLSARIAARAADGHAPQVLVGRRGAPVQQLSGVRGDWHSLTWAGELGRSIRAQLICASGEDCGSGREARLQLRGVHLGVRDAAAPVVEIAGGLASSGSRRGLQTLDGVLSDSGSGVRSVSVEVNGAPFATRTLPCSLSGAFALRLQPCALEPTPRFDVDTAASPFHQGTNGVRVCAEDYSVGATANRTCANRTIRVDNLCPVSPVPGARLSAHFHGGGRHMRIVGRKPVRVVGRLLGPGGAPAAGATVCVASRVLGRRGPETIAGTPTTDSRGRYALRLPTGPNREVRVAHWPNTERALERRLVLRVRPRPTLRLRPRRTLKNGQRLRFRVGLPGPHANGRRVAVQAKAGGRWMRIAGGRTSQAATWRGSYRFRSTTGRRRYSFRAVVPRQPGYPYDRGRSRVRRATVIGP